MTERTCKGLNCSASAENNYKHSDECRFEYATAVASGVKSAAIGCVVSDSCTYIEWRGRIVELIDDQEPQELLPGTKGALARLSIRGDDYKFCSKHGMCHSEELRDPDCDFKDQP